MTRLGIWLALVLAGAWAIPCAAAPLAAYGNLPTIEQMAISPNGRFLAIDFTKGEDRTIVVQDLVAKTLVTGIKAGQVKVRWMQWAGDDHLLVTSSSTSGILGVLAARSEWFVTADLNIRAKRFAPLLADLPEMTGLNVTDGEPIVRTVDGRTQVFLTGIHFEDGQGRNTLFRIALDTDRSNLVVVGEETSMGFVVGNDGRPLAQEEFDATSGSWGIRVLQGGLWRDVQQRKVAGLDIPEIDGLGRDGKSILIVAPEEGHNTLRELSPDGAKLSDPLPVEHWDELLRDPATHRLIGTAVLIGDTHRYNYFDPKDQADWDAITAAFPDSQVTLISESDDRQKRLIRVDSPTEGPGYGLVDEATHATTWLGREYNDLTSDDIGAVMAIDYKAADGLPITGYLTLPRGHNPAKLPLVVLVHGGPAARDEPGFDWWSEGLASQGYAVLRVNYRGSDGFGRKFLQAGYGEWGQKMQTDVSDGVRYLASQGFIDPKRVCIVGASYGGYAAAAGATLDLGVYRCAVDVEGPVELGRFINWEKAKGGDAGILSQRYWDRFMGAKDPSDPHLVAISPADHADKVTVPFLIIHGTDDTVVDPAQGQIMADALKAAGKPYDLVILRHEDHWLSHADTRLQMLQTIADFLKKNNPSDSPGT